MSHRIGEKDARRAERLRLQEAARHSAAHQRLMRRGGYGVVAAIAVVLVAVAVIGGGSGGSAALAAREPTAGAGTSRGQKAPDFSLVDVVSGRRVGLRSLSGRSALLFFSEGVGCQACMLQAAELQTSKTLRKAGIRLVSITTDSPDELGQAARQYGITSMMLADPTTQMSSTYGMLGHGGMGHPTQDGHAFMLLDAKGSVVWHQAYQEMYVKPSELLADMGLKR